MPKKVTLNIVSGFLGAGKTTFIKEMIKELIARNSLSVKPEKIIYVVNEIGEAGVDADIMADQGLLSYELTNGCICCTLKASFSLLLRQIIDDQSPDRIIFEPSGMFILTDFFNILAYESYSSKLQIGSVITIIDAQHHTAHTRFYDLFLQNQARLADLLVVSKLQNIQTNELDYLVDLQFQYPDKSIICTDAWEMSKEEWSQILDRKPLPLSIVRLEKTREMIKHKLIHTHKHPSLDTLTVSWPPEITQEGARKCLAKLASGQFGTIIRAKGFVRCENGIWLVQMVDNQIDWHVASNSANNQLTIIGNQLKIDLIRELFEKRV